MPLKPCPYRQVNDDGLILCGQIKTGDRAISGDDCQVCPVAQVDCSHLRATLVHAGHPPLLVRYGNGKTEVWHDPTPPLAFERAACAALVLPLHSSGDCAGCARRQALGLPGGDPRPMREPAHRRPIPAAGRTVSPTGGQVAVVMASATPERQRGQAAASRIIQLESWRAQRPIPPPTPALVREPVPASLPQGEERRVGWTD